MTVWNRTASRCEELRAQGANVAVSVEELYSSADIMYVPSIRSATRDSVTNRADPTDGSKRSTLLRLAASDPDGN